MDKSNNKSNNKSIWKWIASLPIDLQREIYSWDSTFHILYRQLWKEDITIHYVKYRDTQPVCLWYSDGLHRKWTFSDISSDSEQLYDELETTKRYWVLQSDCFPVEQSLEDLEKKNEKKNGKNISFSSFFYDMFFPPSNDIKWTSLHFFDNLEDRNYFLRHFGKCELNWNVSYQQFIQFYRKRFYLSS